MAIDQAEVKGAGDAPRHDAPPRERTFPSPGAPSSEIGIDARLVHVQAKANCQDASRSPETKPRLDDCGDTLPVWILPVPTASLQFSPTPVSGAVTPKLAAGPRAPAPFALGLLVGALGPAPLITSAA